MPRHKDYVALVKSKMTKKEFALVKNGTKFHTKSKAKQLIKLAKDKFDKKIVNTRVKRASSFDKMVNK